MTTSHDETHSLAARYDWCCHYCGKPVYCRTCEPQRAARDARWITRDHFIPKAHGGRTVLKNIVAACFPCNHSKGDSLPGQTWRHPPPPPEQVSQSLSTRRSLRGGVLLANALWPIFPRHGLDCDVLVFAALNPGRPLTEGPACTCGAAD